MRYATIVADPPWELPQGGSAPSSTWGHPTPGALPYTTLSLEEIRNLPVADLADSDAHLYLWTVNAFLRDSYEVAESWGFRPVQVLVWAKAPRGLGLGGTFSSSTEFILFCRRGSLPSKRKVDSTWWSWKRPYARGPINSAKPEGFLDLVESVSPGPYLELFARRNRLGWDTWGNEALKHVELSV